ncbi:MAG: hypothetical protein Q4F74_02420 [Synergistaceae bacterium]|nr:hypothetical protein [Synergistaceae bacterium]
MNKLIKTRIRISEGPIIYCDFTIHEVNHELFKKADGNISDNSKLAIRTALNNGNKTIFNDGTQSYIPVIFKVKKYQASHYGKYPAKVDIYI